MIVGVGVCCIPRLLMDMKTKDKDKGRMATNKAEILTPSESTSRKEVGVQDSACTTIPSGTTPSNVATEATSAVLDKLAVAVDSVAGKLSIMENCLMRLESQAVTPRNQLVAGAGISTDPDEPYFMSADQPVVKPKHRRIKQVASDVDTLESDSDAKSRKKNEAGIRTGACAGKTVSNVSKCNDISVMELNKCSALDNVFQLEALRPRCVYRPKSPCTEVGFRYTSLRSGGYAQRSHKFVDGDIQQVQSKDQYFKLAEDIIRSGVPNCDGLRRPISVAVNVEAWRRYAHIHGDPRLVEFFTYGFPLGVKGAELQCKYVENHTSAVDYPVQVQELLDKEVQLGAMWGPLDSLPLRECHVSPLMSRPKDSDNRRIIVDLSYGDKFSVNGCTERGTYDGAAYSFTLPSLDYLIADIINRKDPRLIKVDIARAFRNIPIDPGDALKLCLSHNDQFYVDRSLVFGVAHGTAIFQRVSDAICRIMQSKGIHIWNYIDDFFACVEADSAVRAFEQLKSLVVELGLPINETKLVPPAMVMTCVGIQVDAGNKSLKIPDGKIDDIRYHLSC